MSQISDFDAVEHFWCPMLGQTINFAYCRQAQEGLPCNRVLTCFAPHFDVDAFIQEHYTPEQREQFLAPPPSRMDRVMEALEKNVKPAPEDES
ncbi:MAG: hypothetical protein K9K66_19115 [Desulfarculaceae bacterium]|nr:hypothetical protein [Desulfarculaceae bacterium]MCF8074106.1 hypothetical protein [Desulfarculaceae bacterium]MCF8103771.1 hypothetical protein [Desulfarculaceae bacterium]MCF8116840.1 hypothetical protein [Desulfarculaceae bacterium]